MKPGIALGNEGRLLWPPYRSAFPPPASSGRQSAMVCLSQIWNKRAITTILSRSKRRKRTAIAIGIGCQHVLAAALARDTWLRTMDRSGGDVREHSALRGSALAQSPAAR